MFLGLAIEDTQTKNLEELIRIKQGLSFEA